MGNTITNLILPCVVLVILPILIGNTVSGIARLKIAVESSFVIGYFTIWAIFQLVAVPLVLMKQSFVTVVIVVSLIFTVLIIYGLVNKFYGLGLPKFVTTADKIAFIFMIVIVAAFLVVTAFMQHTDADDSRFIVNAVDIVRTNKMFLTNPATGLSLNVWEGELLKDVTSPWAVFIAYCAKITDVHPTIMAHTILQLILTLIMCIVYWMISQVFFAKDLVGRCIFVCLVIMLNVYGHYSVYSAHTFAITRIWQGKAVVASIGIPMLFLLSMWIYEDYKEKANYAMLIITCIGMCLMSGMGIIISAIMVACIGFAYAIIKKNFKVFLGMLLASVPGAVYYLVNLMIG